MDSNSSRLNEETTILQLVSKYRTELMGGAIIGVLIGHLLMYTDHHITIIDFLCRMIHTQGFLFLSGFGLYYSFSKNGSIRDFYKRRVVRLYIPFFLMALPFFLLVTFSEHHSLYRFIAYMTTIDYWLEGNYYGMWYVAVSLALYFTYPLLHNLMFTNRERVLWQGCLIILTIVFAFEWMSRSNFAYWAIVSFGVEKTIIFPLGALCGYYSLQSKQITRLQLVLYFIAMIGILATFKLIDDKNLFEQTRTLIGIPALCLLLEWFDRVKNCRWISPTLNWLGRYSLEIYLLHLFIWWGLSFLTPLSSTYRILIAIPVTLIICSPVHIGISMIENKMIR